MEFKNKTAIVTGGARDIGGAISLKLASMGASVVINYYDNPDDAEKLVIKIKENGGFAVAIQADVTKVNEVERLVKSAVGSFGNKISFLVNNAGGLVARKKMDEMDLDFWNLLITLNLSSVFIMTKYALPFMLDGGSIVNFSSLAARDGGGMGALAYATAKGGVMTFTRGLAKELGPRKIRVNCLSPGMINTSFHDRFTKPEIREKVANSTPLGREGTREEIAETVSFLLSEKAGFINGASIEINGGVYFI